MTTITREQAQKIIEAADEVISALAGTNEDVNPDSDNMLRLWDDLNDRHAPPEVVRELARIALASLAAEPVLFQSCTRPTWNSGVPWTEWKERSRECYEDDLRFTDTPDHAGWIYKCRKLYTTPPVPVIQADVAQAIENLKQKLVECNRYNYCADAVKGVEDACRAAMLHGAEPVSQTYNLPELIEGMEVSIDVSTCDADLGNRYFGTVTEALELDTAKNGYILLVQDAEPNFDVNGNYPVTPDGWISCSERMPKETGDIIVVSDGIVMSGISYSRRDGFYIAALEYDDDEPIGGVTHWMPLPEPPRLKEL
ncbi:DUF551 domain-containing protein [Escherichia coli]|nr:DUF551 domain-containing protein [Escherichia coli]